MGLKRVLTDKWVQEKLLEEIRKQPYIKPACMAAGIHSQRFFEWYKLWKADDPKADGLHDFFVEFEMARGQWECDSLHAIATQPRGTRGKMWILARFNPKRYGNHMMQAALSGFPIPHVELSKMNDRELELYIQTLEAYLSKELGGREAANKPALGLDQGTHEEVGRGQLPAPGDEAVAGEEGEGEG